MAPTIKPITNIKHHDLNENNFFTEVECEDLWQLDSTVGLRSTAQNSQCCDTLSLKYINLSSIDCVRFRSSP